MARENHNGNGDRREAALLKHLREASEKLSSLKQMLTTSLTMRNVDKRNALLNKALQELKRCEKAVGDLFDEGAEWERKFAGLEGACTAGPGLDRETVARLYWACKRFF